MKTPNKVAMYFEGKTWTYLQLATIVGQVADWLVSQGVKKGDPVAMVQGNTEAFIFQWLGIHKAGLCLFLAFHANLHRLAPWLASSTYISEIPT